MHGRDKRVRRRARSEPCGTRHTILLRIVIVSSPGPTSRRPCAVHRHLGLGPTTCAASSRRVHRPLDKLSLPNLHTGRGQNIHVHRQTPPRAQTALCAPHAAARAETRVRSTCAALLRPNVSVWRAATAHPAGVRGDFVQNPESAGFGRRFLAPWADGVGTRLRRGAYTLRSTPSAPVSLPISRRAAYRIGATRGYGEKLLSRWVASAARGYQTRRK